ncbi:MAG TPA: C1 family peptidase [Bacteroidia bacterium]|nr:C1 family peptidase [Bacteroidia bacterium]HRG52658.1 C1 family peptidase [Bacteroidia bacterium]
MKKKSILIGFIALASTMFAQEVKNKKEGNYKFTIVKNMDATPVKNQAKSNTCWSFSSLSFLESELIRMGKPRVELSEMFVVHHAYLDKAEKYVRMHGNTNFAAGGAFHDMLYVMKNYGLVPRSVYMGNPNGDKEINQLQMDDMLRNIVDGIIKEKVISNKNWLKGVDGVLDAYLGKMPENFDYNGKQYTPQTFAASLGIDPNNYIEITSFTHHPFYSKFALEIPDNWQWREMQNVPLNELIDIIDNSLTNGYTVAWGADVGEPGFVFANGVAVVPDADLKGMKKEKIDSIVNNPGKQKEITQELRQEAFNNYETTDDHGMHIVGIAKDQNGTKYYIVKNSWGTTRNDCDGYFYVSEAYMKYKTTSIMINKESLKKEQAKKIGL